MIVKCAHLFLQHAAALQTWTKVQNQLSYQRQIPFMAVVKALNISKSHNLTFLSHPTSYEIGH